MLNSPNILVGCGGSGILSLLRLNSLMAEDPYWRYRISRDVYYVLLDTELSMIDNFEKEIHRQLGGADKPLVMSLRVAQGHVILHPLVRRYFIEPFEQGRSRSGKERLYDHWWHHPDHGPFSAPRVKPLTQGDGQCPAVSYFLTWHQLRQVEDAVDQLVEQIIKRRSVSGEDPLAQMNFVIVAGLAGGTGRGSWQLIAFKVRELLTEKYGIPSPVAYLFDATVFESVIRRYPHQEVPLKVNALTGISELSCWLGNRAATGTVRYELPSMDNPADPQLDVLSVDLDLDPSGHAPVDNAYLIFGGHQRAVLSDNLQYHEMVGTGLYAALSRSALAARRINESPPYLSLGTATFEVNAATLRQYFEGLNRIAVLKRLSRRDEGAVEKAVDSFVKEMGLRIGLTTANRAAFKPDEKGTLLQRACDALLRAADFGGLARSLEDDDPEEVKGEIARLLDPNPAAAENAVRKAVESLARTPEAAAQDVVNQLFRETRSVENARRFAEQVAERLENELADMPTSERMQMRTEENPLNLVEEYQSREYLFFGRHFNPAECKELEQQSRIALLYANYGVLAEELGKRYRSLISAMRRWQDTADVVRSTADKLVGKFKGELQDTIGTAGSEADDFFEALFSDESCPEKTTPDEFAPSRFYRRELRPVLKRGEDQQLLGEPELGREFLEVVSRALLTSGLKHDDFDAKDQLRRALESAVRRTVHLPSRFIENHFSIRRVVTGIRQAWLRRFNAAKGNQEELRSLVDRFHGYYGMRPTLDGDSYLLPKDIDFLIGMGASLAATCRPYWRLKNDHTSRDARCSLFLPILDDDFNREQAESDIQKKLERANVKIEIFTEKERPDDLGDNRANPFIMIAYSVEGTFDLNDIESLNYWQTPSIKKLLLECEDPDGHSVFDPRAQHNGVSFTDPLFLRDKRLQAIRWKPWLDTSEDARRVRNDCLDVLLYAFLKPDPDDEWARQLTEVGWPLPVLRNKGQRRYEFTRRALIWNEGRPREDTSCPWEARQVIAQGLGGVIDVFMGKAKNPDGSLKEEGLRWCDYLRREAATFWTEVLVKLKAPPGSRDYDAMLDRLEQTLDEEARQASGNPEEAGTWRELLERLKERRAAGGFVS